MLRSTRGDVPSASKSVGNRWDRCDDRAPLRFFVGGIRNDDAADVLFAFFEALNEDPVVERSDMHDA